MTRPVKSRFAPSPTGMLHLGGARTALFAYLYAKHHHGQFVLRIEDTDRERSTQAAVDVILEGMAWLGLESDEPLVFQTARMERYQEVLQQLLDSGHAYRCYCSKERLEALRAEQMAAGDKPKYDGFCRDGSDHNPSELHVIRFKNPLEGEVTWLDQVLGPITFQNAELDDWIIARSDGTPTYNFTVVVDDMDMQITKVIRGNDHVNNTPKQINLFHALGVKPPEYGHIPMILNEEGKKLSKRDNAADILTYEKDGILPQALLNYLVRLGWSHGDQEIFSMQEMQDLFDLAHVQKSPARVNPEKLLWLNQHYMKEANSADLVPQVQDQFAALGVDLSQGPDLVEVIKAQAERCKTLKELAEKSVFFYQDFESFDEKAAKKAFKETTLPYLKAALAKFEALADWQPEPLHQILFTVADEFETKIGKVAQPVRVAITGGAVSPPLDQTLYLIGRERVLARIKRALA